MTWHPQDGTFRSLGVPLFSLDKLAKYYHEHGYRLLYLVFRSPGKGVVLIDPGKPDLFPPEAKPGLGLGVTEKDESIKPPED